MIGSVDYLIVEKVIVDIDMINPSTTSNGCVINGLFIGYTFDIPIFTIKSGYV